MLMRTFALSWIVVACTFATGCDSHGGRVEVVGKVKLKGAPVKDGTVAFYPLEGQDTQAQVSISDGAYRVDRRAGLKPGKYLIRISSGDGQTLYNSDEPPGPGGRGTANIISKETIPADWNVNSKQERTVTKDSTNEFDFIIP